MKPALLVPLALTTLLALAAPAAADPLDVGGTIKGDPGVCTVFTHGHTGCELSDGSLWLVCVDDTQSRLCVGEIH